MEIFEDSDVMFETSSRRLSSWDGVNWNQIHRYEHLIFKEKQKYMKHLEEKLDKIDLLYLVIYDWIIVRKNHVNIYFYDQLKIIFSMFFELVMIESINLLC